MSDISKGSGLHDLDAAKGGLVLDRERSFLKDEPGVPKKDRDDYFPMGTGKEGPQDEQDYSKDGAKGKRSGDSKSMSMGSLKKKD